MRGISGTPRRASSSSSTALSLVVLGSLLAIFSMGRSVLMVHAQESCSNSSATYPKGKCFAYSGKCSGVVGNSVFIPDDAEDASVMELSAVAEMKVIRSNAGAVPPACILFTDTFECSLQVWGCKEVDGEAVPILPCDEVCATFWSSAKCLSTANLYYQYVLVPHGQTADDASFPFCQTGYFAADPRPPDTFGGRVIPGLVSYPAGLYGQRRFPLSSYTYTLSTGQVVPLECYNPVVLTEPLDLSIDCRFPLIKSGDECVIPCPFPLYTTDEIQSIIIAFVTPGVIGFVLCVFVFGDSIWVIFETTGGRLGKFLKRYGLLTSKTSSVGPTAGGGGESFLSNNSPMSGGGGGGGATGGSGGRKSTQVRASTLYSLLGSVLGIVFFCVGPLPSLISGSNVSCSQASGSTININELVNASSPTRDSATSSMCRAQRIMPFVLQAIFNLILYSMVRVWAAVSIQRVQVVSRWSKVRDAALVLYCAGIPILCLVIATLTESLSTSLTQGVIMLTREAVICVNRFEDGGVEMALIFLPYLITGIMIVALSAYIYNHLKNVQKQVAGLRSPHTGRSSSDLALRLLLLRLGVLGIFTFIVLIILMSVTGDVMIKLGQYAPSFAKWFGCVSQGGTGICGGETCAHFQDEMNAVRPTVAELAIQLFCMSSICLLFGGFFGAQSASRLYREYSDGSLQKKIEAVWYNGPGGQEASSSVGDDSGPSGSVKRLAGTPTVAGGKQQQHSATGGQRTVPTTSSFTEHDNAVAAYMVIASPVQESS